MRLRPLLWLLLLAIGIAGALLPFAPARGEGGHVDFLTVKGPITPVVASYVERSLDDAADSGAQFVVIRLDTPGGAIPVMQGLVQKMVTARVPVVVWVTPTTGGALSAGTFVVFAAHVAAMAPGTSIGAASPVGGQGQDLQETSRDKAENALVTLIRGLAERRGEEAAIWAEDAVRMASTLTEKEALDRGVIDIIAADEAELLGQLEGVNVDVAGSPVLLHPRGAELREVPMSSAEGLMHAITNPAVAYILMMIGINGIIFELSNPGFGLPGILGGICLLLGLFAMGSLEANLVGLLLIALSFALFIAEVKVVSGGLLTAGGIAALIFGSIVLFDAPGLEVPWTVVITNGVVTGSFVAFAVGLAVRAQRSRIATGREGMIGALGVARSALEPSGQISVLGEIWNARAEAGAIPAGERVEVVSVDGLTASVRRADPGKDET